MTEKKFIVNRGKKRLVAIVGAGGHGVYFRDGDKSMFISSKEDKVGRYEQPLEHFAVVAHDGRINVYEGDSLTIHF